MAIGPCVFPRCRDTEGNPRLTEDTICESCRRRYLRVLDWLAEDYETIAATMPQPVAGGAGRRGKAISFGHPAAWASDTLALIADVLNAIEDNLREHNGHGTAPDPERTREVFRVSHALRYLTDHLEDLCTFPDAGDSAGELVDLHRVAYVGLGMARFREKLPVPCQAPECDARQLFREVGRIYCAECGDSWPEENYPRLTLIIADEIRDERDRILDEYAARHAERA